MKSLLNGIGVLQGSAAAFALVFWHASLPASTTAILALDVLVTLFVIWVRSTARMPDLDKSGTAIERVGTALCLRTKDSHDSDEAKPAPRKARVIEPETAVTSYQHGDALERCICCEQRGSAADLMARALAAIADTNTRREADVVDVQVEDIPALPDASPAAITAGRKDVAL